MKILLLAFSLGSRFVSSIKNTLYEANILKPQKAPLPVISIGNISLGGSEKTPLAMGLVSFLMSQGFKPAFISRGYKGHWEKKGGVLSDGKNIFGKWEDSGDEPFMVSRNLPQAGVFIGKHRLLSCQKAAALGFDLAILDDGFQHRGLHRDINIVLYNPHEKIALREGPSSLKRADILLLKKEDKISMKKSKKNFPQRHVFEYRVRAREIRRLGREESVSAKDFKKKKILAFCGIARPERFFSLLEREDVPTVSRFQFPDHYSYPQRAVKKVIEKWKKFKPEALLTTEKDAVKLQACLDMFQDIPVYYLQISLELEPLFYEEIQSLLQALA